MIRQVLVGVSKTCFSSTGCPQFLDKVIKRYKKKFYTCSAALTVCLVFMVGL